jgi:hypothetical protein
VLISIGYVWLVFVRFGQVWQRNVCVSLVSVVVCVRLILVRFGCLATFPYFWLLFVTFGQKWSRLVRFGYFRLGWVGLCSVLLG